MKTEVPDPQPVVKQFDFNRHDTREALYQARLARYRSPKEVRAYCKKVIEGVGREGGYILDASAIIQNDARVENLRTMTEAVLEYGVYNRGHSASHEPTPFSGPVAGDVQSYSHVPTTGGKRPPGTGIAWQEAKSRLPTIQGDEAICQRIWESIDAMGAMYVWWIALAF